MVEALFCDVLVGVNIVVNIDVVEVEEECTLEEEGDEEHEVHNHMLVPSHIFENVSWDDDAKEVKYILHWHFVQHLMDSDDHMLSIAADILLCRANTLHAFLQTLHLHENQLFYEHLLDLIHLLNKLCDVFDRHLRRCVVLVVLGKTEW